MTPVVESFRSKIGHPHRLNRQPVDRICTPDNITGNGSRQAARRTPTDHGCRQKNWRLWMIFASSNECRAVPPPRELFRLGLASVGITSAEAGRSSASFGVLARAARKRTTAIPVRTLQNCKPPHLAASSFLTAHTDKRARQATRRLLTRRQR